MASVVTPALNETQAPYQFDAAVGIAQTDIRPLGGPINGNLGGTSTMNFPAYLNAGVGSAALTAGSLTAAQLNLPAGLTINNIWVRVNTAANGLTSGQCFAGIYSAGPATSLSTATTGTLVASTANLSATVGTSTGVIKLPLTAAYTTPAAGAYYVALSFNGGTVPVMGCLSGFVTATTSAGACAQFPNASASQYPFAILGGSTGNTTTIPTTVTLTSNSTTNAFCFWAALS